MEKNPFNNDSFKENFINRPAVALNLPKTPNVPFANLSEGSQQNTDPIDLFKSLLSKPSGDEKISAIPLSSFSRDSRYSRGTRPGDNWEEAYAQNQSKYEQAFKGTVKGLNLVGTTVAGGFGTLYGLGSAFANGDITKIWNNPVNQELQAWNEKVDRELLPNFYTEKEQNAEWWSKDNWMTTNFLFDKLIKNSGYAVGAMVGGNIVNSLLSKVGTAIGAGTAALATRSQMSQAFKVFNPVLRGTARAFSQGKNIEATNILKAELSSIADASQRANQLSKILSTSAKFAKFGDTAQRGLVALYSSTGEASMEAIMGGNQLQEKLIKNFIDENGYTPTGTDLDNINETVKDFGKTSFFGNLALLGVTEYVQLPYLAGSSWKNNRTAIRNATDDVVRTGSKLSEALPTTKFGKLYKGAKKYASYAFDPKEAGQEVGQFALEVGASNYFEKATQTDAAENWMDSVLNTVSAVKDIAEYGLFGQDEEGKDVGALVSKEGIEGGILGGITGGVMSSFGKSGKIKQDKQTGLNTKKLVADSENAPLLKEVLDDRLRTVNRGVVLQEQHQDAAAQNDILESKDLKTDIIFNYAMHKIKFGRTDLVIDEIQEMKKQVLSSEDGFSKLQQDGIGNVNDTKEDFIGRLNEIESTVVQMDKLYDNLNTIYGAETITDPATDKTYRKYSDVALEYMAYSATKITDYDKRIVELNNKLASEGIIAGMTVLESIIENNKPNREAVEDVLKQINSLDTSKTAKNALKSDLADLIEVSLRRKSFLQEYDDVTENPSRYTSYPDRRVYGESVDLPVSVTQQEVPKDRRRKPKVSEKKLEIGREYSLEQPLLKKGTELYLAPKLTVLSQTLGGEYEVRLPNGKVEFLTPSEFKEYKISDENNTSEEMEDILDKAIDTVLNKEEYLKYNLELKIAGEENVYNKKAFINDLDDQALIDDIEKEFDKGTKDLLEKRKQEKILQEKLAKAKEALDAQQAKLEATSGIAPVQPSERGEVVGSTDKRKDVSRLFVAGTSPSEDTGGEAVNNLPHVVRARTFLNNFKFFLNRNKIKLILVTPNNAEELGLEGIVQMSYNKQLTDTLSEDEVNVETGFMAQVFIIQTPEGNFFVNEKGEAVSKVGDKNPTILNNIVFETMTSAEFKTVGGAEKVRAGQEAEAEIALEAYKIFRKRVFAQKEYTPYSFAISRGIPSQNKIDGQKEDNYIKDILGPNADKIISGHNELLQVVTKGKIEHNGELLIFPAGTVLIQYGDLLDYANNKNVNNKQANNIFAVIDAISKDVLNKVKSGQPVKLNWAYSNFLQNVLYWRSKGDTSSESQIGIDTNSMQFNIGKKSFSLDKIAENKQEILNALKKAFITVNHKTLSNGVAKKFTEFVVDKEGNLVPIEWANYQTYLLADKYPDGSNRSAEDTPLITHTAKPVGNKNSYKQKYAYITDKNVLPYSEVPAKKVEAPKPAESTTKIGEYEMDGTTVNTSNIVNAGPILFTGKIIKENDKSIVNVEILDNPTIDTLTTNQGLINAIDANLTSFVNDPERAFLIPNNIKSKLGVAELLEEKAKLFVSLLVEGEIRKLIDASKQKTAPKEEKIEEAPKETPKEKPFNSSFKFGEPEGPSEFRELGKDNLERMSNTDLEIFKQWHADNVPFIPFEILENIIRRGNIEAWGVFENGVAKFVRGGLRGTEYHEIFEAIYADFLTESEKNSLLEEFKNKKGEFTDRQSGKKILYSEATDKQAKERIADDFSDFRLGKLPARSLGEAVRNFFKKIMDFFKAFVTKPSLKNELFKAIDSGKFKETKLSQRAKALAPEYRAIEGLTEEQTNDFIQDMVIKVKLIIFREGQKELLFNPEALTGKDVFGKVKELYTNAGAVEALGEERYDALVKKSIEFLRTIGLTFNADEVVSINDENSNQKEYSPNPFSVDWKKHSTGAIKFLLSTLAERNGLNQVNLESGSTLQISEEKRSKTINGLKLLNFNRVFATLLDRLHNTNDPVEFTNKLIQLAKEDANYLPLFSALGGNRETHTFDFHNFGVDTDWRLFIQFFNTFSRQKPDALIQYISEEGDVYTGPANIYTVVKQTSDSWINNMKVLGKAPGNLISYDKQNKIYKIKSFVGRVEKSGNTWNAISPEGKTTNHSTEKEARDVARSYNITIKKSTDMLDFLSKIGIEFPVGTYDALSDKQTIIKGKQTSEVKLFTDAVNSIHTYLGKNNELMTFDGKRLDINGPLRVLAGLYTKVNNPNQDSTYFGVEGQRIGAFSENNAPSYFENTFNEAKTLTELLEKMPQLQDVYSKGSQVLKEGGLFFNELGERIAQIKVGYIQGSKNELSGKDLATSKLSLGERFVQEINQNINGNYYVLIPGDSSTEWMMNLGNVVPMEDIINDKHWKQVYDIYNGYLNDDINLALENRTHNTYTAAKSQELRIMKDILPKDIVKDIEDMIKEVDDAEEETSYADIQDYIIKNKEDINNSIKAFIEEMSKETFNQLINSNQISAVDGNLYLLNKFDTQFLKDYKLSGKVGLKDVMDLINFANINYEINNQEYHKILFGDPYQFKTDKGKLDETKRIKSFLSGRRRTFDHPEYNNKLKEIYNTVDGIELTEGTPGHHKYKEYTNTITLDDVNVVGSVAMAPNMPQNLKDSFVKTNETDAMSWLMDNTHKEIALKEGQWSVQAEDFHQWHMAYTRQAFLNKNLFKTEELKKTYKNSPLNKKDADLILTSIPKHKLAIRKPIISGNKFNKTEIDLVLDKTSQMPLYYHMVEGTSLESMYLKMFDQEVGYGIVISGRKVGSEGVNPIYAGNGSFSEEKFTNIVQVPWKIYGTQVETMSEGEKTQTRGSQLTKGATSDLYENGEPIGATPERQQVIKDAVKRNTEILDLLNKNAYNELLNKLGVTDLGDGYALEDKQRVSETLMYEMMRRELSENAKDTIALDKNGEFLMPFEASPSYVQIKSILYSMVNKALISPAMNGAPHVQVPVTMFEKATEGRSLARKTATGWTKITKKQYEALTEEEKKSVMLTDDTLKFYTKENPYCEIMLPHWFKNKFGKKTDEEILQYLNTTEGKKILSGIGFRIPTQALSSVEVFKVKGFLPQYMGYTVVVPSEITTKAGSDFDIDKLNIYLKSVYTDANGNVRLVKWQGSEQATKDFFTKVYNDSTERKTLNKVELIEAVDILLYGLEDTKGLLNKYGEYILSIQDKYPDGFEFRAEMEKELDKLTDENLNAEMRIAEVNSMYKKSLENEYYDSLEELLTLPENFNRLISPIDDAGLEDLSELLDKKRGYNESGVQGRLINRNFMTKMRHGFITGKRWVGIAAVNITNLSLRQKSKVYLNPKKLATLSAQELAYVQDLNILLPHNTLEDKGNRFVSLSGTKTADGTQFISDRLSGYATAFVDIANKPFITKIIKSDVVVSTFMFLESIGAGNAGIYFLNQPIIEKYLEFLDSTGSKSVMGKRNLEYIKNQFPTTEQLLEETEISVEQLLDNIQEYGEKGEFTQKKNAEQQLILNEFVKYKILADQLFSYTQATNYDTTKFGSSDALMKKEWATFNASNFNLISNVDEVLKNTFIGKQAELLAKSFASFGAILKTELPEIKAYTISTLKKYATKKYMSMDDYEKIANLIKNSFIDYIIQNNTTMSDMIKPLLVDSETAVVTQLEQAKQKYPSIQLLKDLVPVLGNREGSAKSIQLKANVKDAYSENLYVGMMRELRDSNAELNDLYNNIINVAILQGTTQSAISIRNIIPVEDYAAKIAPIIQQLKPNASLDAFANGMFERNNFANADLFTEFTPFANEPRPDEDGNYRETDYRLNPNTGEDELLYYIPALKKMKGSAQNLLVLSDLYNSFQLSSDYIKIPKVITARNGKKVNIGKRTEVTAKDYALMKQKGSQELYDAYYYKKVYTKDVNEFNELIPLTTTGVNAKTGDVFNNYYYKLVNVYGDGNRAVEFNTSFGPSVIDNGSMRLPRELADQDIVNAYASKIKEKAVSLPTQTSVEMTEEPKGVKVKDGIYVNQEALSKDEQLELFDYLKPFLEEQGAKTNTGKDASKMIGLGLRWDYKSNNIGKQAMNIPDVINPGNKTKYGYYDSSINNQPLAPITPRFRELMQKATGVDMTNYDGAIINLYESTSFISSHSDVDESRSAIGYPVIGINLGGTGNFSIESRDGDPKQLNLKAGAGYVFGVNGVNRDVYHRTFAKPQDSFLPALNTKIDGKTYEPGSYRVTVTMRRVMPLEPGMPSKPAIVSTPANKPGEQLGLFGDTITLKDGKDYNKSDINSALLESLGYTPKEIGKILKQIC